MEKKEEQVLAPFFASPKQWHFDELLDQVNISRSQLSEWLKKLENEKLIVRVKERGKMPYYMHNFDNPAFQNRKRLFGLRKLNDSGLFNHLATLKGADLIILFGSYSRSDWYDNSDIDLFIYGSDNEFEKGKFELKLKKEIQLFNAQSRQDLRKMGSDLILNIIEGFIIKGSLTTLGVRLNV